MSVTAHSALAERVFERCGQTCTLDHKRIVWEPKPPRPASRKQAK
jgi:hypothetical protein